tara:strand:- start:357 stop:920 length:564 start_codon:yes stop_codon:yes gene_type:complete
MLLLIESKNIFKNTWGQDLPPGSNINTYAPTPTFTRVNNMKTYNYEIDLNQEVRNARYIKLIDYSISKPDSTTLSMKDNPSFILKVNDYELVTHHTYQHVFKSIPYNKLCEHDVKNAKYYFDNSNNVIRSIKIQLCKLDENLGTPAFIEELDPDPTTGNPNPDVYHNSFLFEIGIDNNGETRFPTFN